MRVKRKREAFSKKKETKLAVVIYLEKRIENQIKL
jgi:hypothetical protein